MESAKLRVVSTSEDAAEWLEAWFPCYAAELATGLQAALTDLD